MSTRCQIGFYESKDKKPEEFTALLYKHSDGYPGSLDGKESGVLPEIIPFLKLFNERRGNLDLEYCAAWLCWHLINQTVNYATEFAFMETATGVSPFDGITCLGHGISDGLHGDIEYLYRIIPERKGFEVQVMTPIGTDDFKLIETHVF